MRRRKLRQLVYSQAQQSYGPELSIILLSSKPEFWSAPMVSMSIWLFHLKLYSSFELLIDGQINHTVTSVLGVGMHTNLIQITEVYSLFKPFEFSLLWNRHLGHVSSMRKTMGSSGLSSSHSRWGFWRYSISKPCLSFPTKLFPVFFWRSVCFLLLTSPVLKQKESLSYYPYR